MYKGFDAKTSTRIASRSTVDTTWWQNADGSLTERLSQEPVNFKDSAGAWQPIDPSLVRGSDGRLHQRANGFGLSFAGGVGVSGASASVAAVGAGAVRQAAVAQDASSQGQLVNLSLGGGDTVAWSLSGAIQVSPAVSADGTTTTYPQILPDTTLQLTSETYGLKEAFVLSSASAPNSWTFPLALTGVSLTRASDGTWQLVDGAGAVVATLLSPDAVDSNVDPHSGEVPTTHRVTYTLSTVGGVEQLTMTLDPAWLADPARVFPVTVDPTVSVSIAGQQQSTYVDSAYPNQNYLNYGTESQYMKIGNDGAGDYDHALAAYPSGVAGTGYNLSAAQFAVFDQHAWNTASSYGYTVYAAGAAWSPSTVTWNNQPGQQATLGSWSGSSSSTTCASVSGRWEYTSLSTGAMDNFTARGYQWFGVLLATPGDSTDSNYWKVFDSSQVSSCSPYIQLTYNPDVPPQVDSMSPLDGTPVSTLTPQLTATGHDPDNYPNSSVSYHFSVFSSTGGASIADSGGTYQSSGVWSVPAGKLAWGKSYQWTVDVFDGYTTQTTRIYNAFTTTAPPPVLTGGLSQSSDGHGFSESLGNYTTSATDADVAGVGPTLSVVRDYNSLDSRTSGAFGASWSSLLDAKATQVLDTSGNLVEAVVTYPDGSQVVFAANADGSFAPPAGRYATLAAAKSGSGAFAGYVLTDKDGTTYSFEQAITAASGTGTSVAVAGVYGITAVADRLGHTVNFAYAAQTFTVASDGTEVADTLNVITTETSSVSGRALHFTWFAPVGARYPHVQTVKTDQAASGDTTTAQLWTYQYQKTAAGDELTGVCAPSRNQASVSESACTLYTYAGYSDYQNGVLDGDPSSYWPLSDAAGSASAASRAAIQGGTDAGTYTNVNVGGAGHLAGSSATTAGFNPATAKAYVTLPSSLLVNRTYLSVALWFQTTTAGGILFSEQSSPITSSGAPSNATASLYIGTDGKLYGAWYAGAIKAAVSNSPVTDGAWHYAVLSGSGNSQTLYLDGSTRGVTEAGVTGVISNLGQTYEYVGAGYSSGVWPNEPAAGWNYFTGSISDVAYYTRGLTSTEAGGLYALGNSQGAFLTSITRPSAATDSTKKPAAQVSYDPVTGRVSSVTDANGAVWGLSAPSVVGSDQPFRAAVLAQAPEYYWRLGDPSGTSNPVDQINNDAWNSSTGVAAYTGATTLGVPGVFSGDTAASFDGTSSYVTLPSGILDYHGNVSVSLWFKTSATSGVLFSHSQAALSAGSTTTNYQPWLYVGSDGKLVASVGTSGAIESGSPVNNGNWHYAVFAVSGTSQVLYVDGKRAGQGTPHTDAANEDNLYLGTGFLGGGWPDQPNSGAATPKYFNGSIAEAAIYDSTLSDAQASELWQGYNSTLVSVIPLTRITLSDPADSYDGAAHSEEYDYDPLHGNRLVRHVDALGGQTVYGYDTSGFLNAVTDPNGDQTITGHDVRGNEVSRTTCRYEAQNQCQTSYSTYFPDDTTAVLSYPLDPRDDQDLTASDARSANKDDATYRTSYALDPVSGLRTSVTTPPVPGFPSGRTTTTAYTDGTTAYLCNGQSVVAPKGLVQKVTTPGGAVTTTSYYADGDTCQVTDADGLITSFTYDGLGRVSSKTVTSDTYPSGLTTRYVYDGVGHVETSTAPTVTEYVITANHNHTAVTSSQYDVDGNLVSQVVADSTGGDTSRPVFYGYNQYDQKSSSSDARSASSTDTTYQTTYTYDAFGNVENKTDPLGRTTQYLYDADNRLRTTQQLNTAADTTASTGSTLVLEKRSYDAGGRLASVVDAQGYTTNYLYYDDNLTYQVSKTDGSSTYITERDSYDQAGNLVKKLTNNLVTETDYTIDAAGRTTATVLDPAGVNRTTKTVYSADDDVLSSTTGDANGSAVTDFADDAMGNALSRSVTGHTAGSPSGWWPLQQTGTDPVAYDASGSSDTGTLTSGASWIEVSCVSGGAPHPCGPFASFNGTGGQITAAGPAVNTASSYSVSAWVNLSKGTSNVTAVSQSGSTAAALLLQNDAATNAWRVSVTNADASSPTYTGVESAANSVSVGTWTLLTATIDSAAGTMTLYVNGAKAGSVAVGSLWNATGPLVIGAAKASGAMTQFFPGMIANVQTYQRALSASDISTLYSAGVKGLPLDTTASTHSWTRDERGLPTSMTDADGNITQYTYDEAGRLARTTSPTVTTTTVDPQTGTPTTTPNTVAITSTGYDTFGEVTETEDALGNETINTYDAAGNKTSTTAPAYTPPGASAPITAQATYRYDADSELTTVYDPVANQASAPTPTAQYTYTNLGLKHTATDAATNVTTYAYDSDADLLKTTVTTSSDSTGVVTSATYDYLGRTQTSTQVERYPSAAAYTTQYNYADAAGLLTSTKLPSGNTPASYVYDNIGEKTQSADASSNTTTYAYDYAGRVVKTTLPDHSYTTTSYDQLGDVTASAAYDNTGAPLSSTSASYDGEGRQSSATDALGATDTFAYDATGLLTGETQPVCVVSTQTPTCPYTAIKVSYGYDLDGHQTAYTNGNGQTTYTSYNSWGLPESVIEPAATATTYTALSDRTATDTYDADGRLASQTQPGGVSTAYTYNPTGTLAQQTGTGAAAASATRTFSYDAFGDVTRAATSNTSITSASNATSESFTYDDRGDLLTTSGSAGSSSFGYNGDGLLTSRQDASSATATTYAYDSQDRLSTLTDPLTATTATYTYTPQSQPNAVTYGTGGDVRTFGYDSLHRLTSDTLTSGSSAVASIRYRYDANGDLTGKTTSSAFAQAASNSYTYDLAGRLTSWNNGATTTAYSYDRDSNRTQVGANVYTYDQRDELTSDGTNTYSYTARGTMTAKTNTATGTTLLAYTDDAYNQQTAAGTAVYTYDAAGRMITQTAGAATTTLQYSGPGNLVASDGTTGYSRTPGGALFSDAPAATGTGGTLDWTDLHTDVVGSFTPTGTTLAGSTSYDPLGNTLGASGHRTSLGYQSEWTDTATGQVNMAARWYNPATGQFTSKDAARNSATPDTANANPFGYADANPLTGTDPTGNCPADKCGVPGQPDTGGECNVAHNCNPQFGGGTGDNNGGGGGGRGSSSNDPTTVYTIAQDNSIIDTSRPNDGSAASKQSCGNNFDPTDVSSRGCWGKVFIAGVVSWGASTLDFFCMKACAGDASLSSMWDDVAAQQFGITKGSQGARYMHDVGNGLGLALAVVPGIGAVRDAAELPEGVGLAQRGWQFVKSYLGFGGSSDGGAAAGWSAAERAADDASAAESLGSTRELAGVKKVNVRDAVEAAQDASKKAPPPTKSDTGGSTTVVKPSTNELPTQLTIKAVHPDPVEATTEAVAAPDNVGAVTEATTNAVARPGDGTLDDSGAPGLSCVTHSFTGSTPVLMADGTTKPIDQIKTGDHIANAVPSQTGTQDNTVTNVIVTTTDHDFVNLDIAPLAKATTARTTGESLTVASTSGANTPAKPLLKSAAVALASALTVLSGVTGGQASTANFPRSAADGSQSTIADSSDITQHGGTLSTTFHHPFYDITQAAFVDAQNLKPGDELQTPSGYAIVTGVRLYHANTVTYDLTIGALHTYYVVAGSTPVLVHNCVEGEEGTTPAAPEPGPPAQYGPFYRAWTSTPNQSDEVAKMVTIHLSDDLAG